MKQQQLPATDPWQVTEDDVDGVYRRSIGPW
jgi:hypothetical protein